MKLHTCDSVGGGNARGGVENLFHAHVVLLQSMLGVYVCLCMGMLDDKVQCCTRKKVKY